MGIDGEARFMLMNLWLTVPNYGKALEQENEFIKKDRDNLYYYAALYYRPFCIKQMGNPEFVKSGFRMVCIGL